MNNIVKDIILNDITKHHLDNMPYIAKFNDGSKDILFNVTKEDLRCLGFENFPENTEELNKAIHEAIFIAYREFFKAKITTETNDNEIIGR